MKNKIKNITSDIVQNQTTCIFVSPHLDDAALSAGELITYLSDKTKVLVVTVFTKAGDKKHSLSAKSYIKSCGYEVRGTGKLYENRRMEDKRLYESLGVKVIHLGFLDALWRRNGKKNLGLNILSKVISDFDYIYPTHKFHIAKGKINKADLDNLRLIGDKLKKFPKKYQDAIVFCPLGIGNHVDHIVTREACRRIFKEVIYWEDGPYNVFHHVDNNIIRNNNLVRSVFSESSFNRMNLYRAYETQYGKIFKGKTKFDFKPEAYYKTEQKEI